MSDFPSTDNDFEKALRYLSQEMPDTKVLLKPTLLHSTRVGIYLYNQGYKSSICIAGLLHDLVEDSTVTIEDIETNFGKEVAKIVSTNTKKEELNENIKYNELLKRCIESGEDAAIVKSADIIDNLITYRKIKSDKGIRNMLNFANILLGLKPKEYSDKIFQNLQEML